MIVGDRLKEARRNKGLSQIEVMRLTNINNKTLSGYENGVSEPDLETLLTLSRLYGVTMEYLMGQSENPNEKIMIDDDFHRKFIEVINSFKQKGYSDGVILEWLLQLDKTLSEAKKKYVNPNETEVIWGDINDPEGIDRTSSDEKIEKIIKLKRKLNNPNYIPPWKRDK